MSIFYLLNLNKLDLFLQTCFLGQPYPDPAIPPQRQDRFYSTSGRLSGPAELRSINMPSSDKVGKKYLCVCVYFLIMVAYERIGS